MDAPLHQLYGGAAVLLFWLGLYGVISRPESLAKIMSVNVMGGGVFLLLISIAWRNTIDLPDPVPHAMVLTGIVVALSATSLAIALARRLAEASGHDRAGEDEEEEH
jgi:multicomponent Na+:H+ antiporter subunit C